MGEELFAGAGLAQNRNSRVERRDLFRLMEHASERFAPADDLAEVAGDANLLLQVDVFVVELIL